MMATMLGVAMLGLTACKNEKPEPTNPVESTTYAVIYNGASIAAGQTIEHHPSLQETENDFASFDLFFENKTDAEQPTVIKLEKTEGPDALNTLMVCFGATCSEHTCPWTSDVVTLTPGINQQEDKMFKIEYTPSMVTAKAVFRLTVGKGTSMSDPQVIYFQL